MTYAEEQNLPQANMQQTEKEIVNIKPIKLKSKCIKQNPLVTNQTDQTLLSIYERVCEKDVTPQQKNDLLAKAAMRMYELKQPLNALTLAKQLQQQNVRGATLTDVTFLASVEIANTALQQMRNDEMRYLNEQLTYPPAKQLSEAIQKSLPAPVTSNIKAITDETVKKEFHKVTTPVRNTPPKTRVSTVKRPTPPVRPVVVAPVAPKPPVTNTPNKSSASGNPFASLKN